MKKVEKIEQDLADDDNEGAKAPFSKSPEQKTAAEPELLPLYQRYLIAALLVLAIWLMTYVCEC